jgi:hypothetical protein
MNAALAEIGYPEETRVRPAERAPDPKLFNIANRVARTLGVMAVLVTAVDDTKQTFLAHSGLPADFARANGTTRQWSFCQYTVRNARRLVVADTREDERFASNPLMQMNVVRAYAGVPVIVDGLGAVGAVCVIHNEPRTFDESDIAMLEMAAQLVAAQIETENARARSFFPPSARTQVGAVPEVGTLLDGKYWITAALGEGGQASVFLGRDRLTGQLVAIKLMQAAPDAEATLIREARALASVRHPNLVALHGWGRTDGGRLYVVLDYVEGATLEHPRSSLPSDEEAAFVVKTTRELAGALATMHGAGLLHGDVKPSNVMLDRQLSRAVLIDLGIGVELEQNGARAVGGTPGFSAPEQFCGDVLTPSADVYGLAATIYAILAGRGPFHRHPGVRLLGAQMGARFSPLSELRPDVPEAVSTLLSSCLNPNPVARPTTVLELSHALERAYAHHTADRASLEFAHTPRTCGRMFRLWREEVLLELGARHDAYIVSQLSPSAREVVMAQKSDDGWYDADAYLAYLQGVADGNLKRLETFGELTTNRVLADLVAMLNLTRTAATLLNVFPDMARKVGDWLDVTTESLDDGGIRLNVNMPPRFAPTICAVHRGSVRSLGRFLDVDLEVTEPHCRARGDATCDLELRWPIPVTFG